MRDRNGASAVSRIENVPAEYVGRCKVDGYDVVTKSEEYLYRTADVAGLKGDRYKSSRSSYNQCVKQAHPLFRCYRPDDRDACMDVLLRWRTGMAFDNEFATLLADDAMSAHRYVLCNAAALEVVGRVAEVERRVAGYTFGYPLVSVGNETIFCVLMEIADRTVKGLPQFLFREFCRELSGYDVINAMDDAGLPGLRRAKLSYHPARLAASYIVTEKRRP
jgi:hypothetical protein